ncbi:MAG: UDP-N-acetylmuramate--L-alanine ligase [Verrucomicrobiia bacterium]
MSVNVRTTDASCLNLPVKAGETVYLIGAGGCGMSALGHILLDLNFRVVGSDICLNKNTEQLAQRGAKIFSGHNVGNIITSNPSLVIYTSAIGADNPELAAARSILNVPVFRRGEFLSVIANQTNLVCVAGMHGKTTTSALLAYAFESLGYCSGYSIGWNVPQLERNGKFNLHNYTGLQDQQQERSKNGSKSSHFVIEADESDGTLNCFEPLHSVILNIDREHLDYFGSFEQLKKEFCDFASRTKGGVIYCADDPSLLELIGRRQNAFSYGFSESADYRIKLIGQNPDKKGFVFEVFKGKRLIGNFSNSLFGVHNVSNAAAAISLLDLLGFSHESILPVIKTFKGAERRQEELLNDKIRVFDDYGHHPSEIRATINGLKPLCGKRLLVVFQPHRFTRTRDLYIEFGNCFQGAQQVWVMDIYGAAEKPITGVTSRLIVDEILKNGIKAEAVCGVDEACEKVFKNIADGDVILFCGAGADVTVAAHKFVEKFKGVSGGADCGRNAGRRQINLIIV